ncbi:hypothetical protein CEAn_00093 [Coxiella endosymbiont of Amblyomma nuttalli]|nr:hypothetical protein CEAn_00093 [Coxiella endosymbiont of Amblyomma nuttalli]
MRTVFRSFCLNTLIKQKRQKVITDVLIRDGCSQLDLVSVNVDALLEQHDRSQDGEHVH